MAKKATAADPFKRNYAEDTSGTFSSRRPGGYGGPSREGFPVAVAPEPGAATRPPLSPKPLSGLAGQGVIPDTAVGRTTSQSPLQMHQQDEFDRRMGFEPTKRSPEQVQAIADYLNPAKKAVPTTPVQKTPTIPGVTVPPPTVLPAAPVVANNAGPLGVLSGVAPADFGNVNLASSPPRSPLDVLRGVPATPSVPRGTTGSEQAGAATRRALGTAVNVTGKAELAGWDALTGVAKTVGSTVARPFQKGWGALAGFTRGLTGASTAAGVSNSSAAQFGSPTQTNPIPVTPTTPTANIDRSENAIGRFGLSDQEFKRKRVAGF